MRYGEFRALVQNYPFFSSSIFTHLTDNVPLLRRQVSGWIKQGYVITLKRGLYCLRDEDRTAKFSRYFLANKMYTPSYISLETALSYHGLIPEGVHGMVSVATKKTQSFQNLFGSFVYHKIKKDLFGDFSRLDDEFGNTFFMATKERAIIDLLYFKTRGMKKIDKDIFELSFRLQNIDQVEPDKLIEIARKFNQNKLSELVELFLDYQREIL